jgi:hypothetical protein
MTDTKLIQSKIAPLKKLLSQLDKTIKDKKTRDYLLLPASQKLRDVEAFLLPNVLKASNPKSASMWLEIAEFELHQAEERLNYAQKMVSTYGPDLLAIG